MRYGVGVGEPRTGGREIKGGGAMAADRLFHQHRGARHWVVGGEGRNNDQINGVGRDASNGECAGGGNRTHRCGRLTSASDVSLTNASARADPLITRLNNLLEIGVGEDRLRYLVAPADNVGRTIRQRR